MDSKPRQRERRPPALDGLSTLLLPVAMRLPLLWPSCRRLALADRVPFCCELLLLCYLLDSYRWPVPVGLEILWRYRRAMDLKGATVSVGQYKDKMEKGWPDVEPEARTHKNKIPNIVNLL